MTKKRLKEIADFAVTDDAPYETLEEAQEAMPTLTESKQMASALLEAREENALLIEKLDDYRALGVSSEGVNYIAKRLLDCKTENAQLKEKLEKLEKALDLMAMDLQRAEKRETVLLYLNADLRLKLDAQASVLLEKK